MSDETKTKLRIALAQCNPTVGDIAGNAELARKFYRQAADEGADLVVFTELFLAGYPPEDLILKPAFVAHCRESLTGLAEMTKDGGPGLIMGVPWEDEGKVYNAVAVIDAGEITATRYKAILPNYGVFDEKRVFEQGPMPGPVNFRGVRIGIPICEDIWVQDVCECLEETGAELLIVPNGSPYSSNKHENRMMQAVARVSETGLPMIYVNQVGGQDELVFDGASFVLNRGSQLRLQLPAWEERMVISDWSLEDDEWTCEAGELVTLADTDTLDYSACVMGLRDYVEKNGFPSVVLGLSGGIDSAITAAMAVDALGAERVHCVMLPYHYTSNESLNDAAQCAEALGVRYDNVAIAEPVEGVLASLSRMFEGTPSGITEENIQSRIRGLILMAISNKFGSMVVTTGNKSEVSVGYATLYGDMNGGYNPVKDLYKTRVYELSEFRNKVRPQHCLGPEGVVIPENIITKAPTAELRENQTDQDSLPPYDQLDDILECLVEQEMTLIDIVARGHDPEIVKKIQNLLYIAEYKRRQAAPGVKVTERNFGRDRRYPITNRFRENIEP